MKTTARALRLAVAMCGVLASLGTAAAAHGYVPLTTNASGLSLLSPVRPGASGSAVLDAGGLYLGMVVERVAVAGTGVTTLAVGIICG